MRKLSALILFTAALTAGAQSITSTSNFTWSPDLLTVTAGTEITITVTGNHHMREVSEETWNMNGTTSNGGFDFPVGTHSLTLTEPGTYWYVCVPHATSGMKGVIIVEGGTGVAEITTETVFSLYPNPAKDQITVLSDATRDLQLSIIDVQGRAVLQQALQGNDRIGVGQLPDGNYTVLLLDTKGNIQERQRLSITH